MNNNFLGLMTMNSHWPQLNDVQFYAYGASAPDAALQAASTKTYPTIEQYFKELTGSTCTEWSLPTTPSPAAS